MFRAASEQYEDSFAHVAHGCAHLLEPEDDITMSNGNQVSIFAESELMREAVIRKFRIVRQELDFHLDANRQRS
ncbi:MAG: hypothetical protein A3I66_11510 [Burkholderiales bacterium RIFCSPLOWO2_02_FULL_57_36]|nr:MAG: hypothetical protein A3I66_11510 [Burkholderiales bacterium RIFCSPLOWO2_02_FULL_57_36]